MVSRRERKNNRKRELRRSFGVSAYVGANGGGKTLAMVHDSLPSLEAGRPVLSTVRIQDYANPRACDDPWCIENPGRLNHFKVRMTKAGKAAAIRNSQRVFLYGEDADLEEVERVSTGVHLAPHPLWIPWTSWTQLLEFQFGEVLADEMTNIAEARASAVTLPTEVVNQFQQMRRDDIPFRYTMPDWGQADKSLRRPTQSVTVCEGYRTAPAPADGHETRVIRARERFEWKTYPAMLLTELTEGKRADLRPEVRDKFRRPGSVVEKAYDTFAPVLGVGHVSESGRCVRCGGTRPAPKCTCGTSRSRPEAVPDGAPARRRGAARTDAPPATEAGRGRRSARHAAAVEPAACCDDTPELLDTPGSVLVTAPAL